ncbi:MAG TPA: Spy/CpxP family protein refolding chaperone [Longimicrobiales bacterium]|nr:Spy/CpxP family protein refolding chaperone [Longimicrobiales bacterium]
MKQGRSLMMALAVTVLAALPAQAQQGGMGGQGRGGMGNLGMARALTEQGSVEFLVSKAADLKITDAQKTALQALATAWATTVKESREQVKANMPAQGQGMGGAPGGDREAMMARFQALQPHMQKLTEEDAKSVEEAMKLLNDEQKVAAKALLDARAESTRPRRPGGPGGARGGAGGAA